MIEGLKIDVPSEEMKSILNERVQHHQERVEFYESKAAELTAGGAEAADYTGGDPVRSLKDSAERHRSQMAYFDFLAKHVVPGEVYRIDEADLARLEITGNRRYH